MRFGALWKNAEFLKLWAGETVSLFGSQITLLALPLVAVLVLRASPAQMGILGAVSFAPFLLVTLFAGVWIDRYRRRPLMIAINLAQALFLGVIPLCAFLGILRIEYIYVIAFITGTLTVFFQLAFPSYLPSLVVREQLVEGNSKLNVSLSLAEFAGPSVAGVLVLLITAPFAIILDSISFLFSTFSLLLIRKKEPLPTFQKEQRNFFREIGEGLQITFRNPYIRAFAIESGIYNLFYTATQAIYVLYLVRELKISPGILGLILSLGSIGALLGAFVTTPLARRLGIGPSTVGAMVLTCLVQIAIPFANGSPSGIILLAAVAFCCDFSITVISIHGVSLRQTIIPERLLGRANASYRFCTWGVIPFGYLLGGFLGEQIGLRLTLIVCTLCLPLALPWIFLSPVPKMREMPSENESNLPPANENEEAILQK